MTNDINIFNYKNYRKIKNLKKKRTITAIVKSLNYYEYFIILFLTNI